jgi:hypothetical protein
MIFSDSGWKAEVELIEREDGEKGVKYTLRVIQTILRPEYINPEAIPKDGEIFTAWKSHNSTYSGGWRMGDL